jgi:mRNA-degrading endonuclease RelE of RelBE toxin-antitoxin system
MPFSVDITQNVWGDLRYFRAYEQRIITDGIRTYLTTEAGTETNKRKQLEPNDIAIWELRIDHYRVFYDIDGMQVYVIAIALQRDMSF